MKPLLLLLCLLSFTLSLHHHLRVQQCPCDTQGCPSCMLANTLKQNHEDAEEMNLEDAETQKDNVKVADLQNKLFLEAQKYAEQTQEFEGKA